MSKEILLGATKIVAALAAVAAFGGPVVAHAAAIDSGTGSGPAVTATLPPATPDGHPWID